MARPKKVKVPAVTVVEKVNAAKPLRKARQATVVKARSKAQTVPKKSSEELMTDNLAAMSQLVKSMAETLEMLVLKTESLAFHVIATEEILAELVADNGLNLSRVNARIRLKLSAGSDSPTDPSMAIDIAAAIASPLPRR